MMKQIFCGLLLLVLSVSLVFGVETFSAQNGFDWLSAQMSTDGSFGNDVTKTALAIAALDSAGYDTSLSEKWLDTKLSSDGCYPSGSCDTKVTALSVVALNEVQDDSNFDDILAWYEDSQVEASVSGDWYLEVITSASGDCVVSYDLEGILKEITVPVDAGIFTGCDSSHFLDLDDCLQANLISANPGIELNVDCTDLDGNVVLTLLYKSSSTYYILSNVNAAEGDFVVPNGCYGRTRIGTCDLESTLYSDWAVKYLGGTINNLVYLKENYDDTDPKKVAMMYLVTGEDKYLVDLAELQKSDGSFNRDHYSTALAILALKNLGDYSQNVEDAKSYLREEQATTGDWAGSVENTAMVLYAAFNEDDVTPSSESIIEETDDEEKTNECTLNDDCGTGYECNYGVCETVTIGCDYDDDCDSGEVCLGNECVESDCNDDGKCEYPEWNENVLNCPSDCYCGDGICDDEESSSSCSEDCEIGSSGMGSDLSSNDFTSKKSSNKGLIVVIVVVILLILLGIGGYFAYKKGYLDSIMQKFKKGGSGGSAQYTTNTAYNPFTKKLPPQQPGKQF